MNEILYVHEMHDKHMHQVLLFYHIFYWTSNYWWGCAAAHPKRGVLGTGTTQKRGVLGTGTTHKRGVLGTGTSGKRAS